MAWTTPITWTNAVLTAAQLNQQVSANFNETAPGKATTVGSLFAGNGLNSIVERYPAQATYAGGGTDTTTSTTYASLTGGSAVTATTGSSALVFHGATVANDTVGARSWASYTVSGASSISSSDNWGVAYDETGAGRVVKVGHTYLATGLTGGSNTFTQQMRVSGGTGTYVIRTLGVIPL